MAKDAEMVRRNKNGTRHETPQKKPVTSFAIIKRTCREHWAAFVRQDGALAEDAHREYVKTMLLTDPDFVRLRRSEDLKRIEDDIVAAVRTIGHESRPSAKSIDAARAPAIDGKAIQLRIPLPSMAEFEREKYQVPITGEWKAGPALLVKEGKAVLLGHRRSAAEHTTKGDRLQVVLAAAEARELSEDDTLAKVWAVS